MADPTGMLRRSKAMTPRTICASPVRPAKTPIPAPLLRESDFSYRVLSFSGFSCTNSARTTSPEIHARAAKTTAVFPRLGIDFSLDLRWFRPTAREARRRHALRASRRASTADRRFHGAATAPLRESPEER